jgi:hypothetical protein
MKTFTDYFHDSERVYHYTIKLACDSVSENMVDAIEQRLARLDIVALEEFAGSPLQENPLDFPNLHNTSVQVADFSVKYPCSTDMLERMVAEALGMQRTNVIVYTENDPRKAYTQNHLDRNDPSYKENYVPAIGSDHPEVEGEKEAQQDYPKQAEKMMQYLEKARSDRKMKYHTNKLIPEQLVDAPAGGDMGPMGEESPFTPETRG